MGYIERCIRCYIRDKGKCDGIEREELNQKIKPIIHEMCYKKSIAIPVRDVGSGVKHGKVTILFALLKSRLKMSECLL